MSIQKSLKGGNGAAEYGVSVYGAGPDQHAQHAGDNVIAMKHGGRRRRSTKRRGGTPLAEIIVPAALVYANHAFAKRSYPGSRSFGFKGKSVNRRRSYRQTRRRRGG